jgi:DNA-binding response OmpR family regulator
MRTALPKESIMIVDDEPENLNVLLGMLDGQGWVIRVFPRGELALHAAYTNPPDLVLLDILMPGIGGYETCLGFKKNDLLKDIPIIFLSALTDSRDKMRAFEAGGVDYITKPFYEAEVRARVRAQLALRRNQLQLENLVLRRTGELVEAHRRLRIWDDAKTQWLNLLSHEMRTPLTGIIGTAEVLFSEITLDPDMYDLRRGYEISVRRINKLIDDAMLLTQIDVDSDGFIIHSVSCNEILTQAVQQAKTEVSDVEFQLLTLSGSDCVLAESDLLRRAFTDLLLAAACCVLNDGKIRINTESSDTSLSVFISTDEQSLPEEDLASFFEVGGQRTLLKGGGDFGLATAVAQRIIQLFGGECSVRNGESVGIVIGINLPIYGEEA